MREPLVGTGSNGTPYAMFTIASNHRWTDRSGNTQTETAFISCRCFGAWVDALQGKGKGEMVFVTGWLRTESFERDGAQVTQLGLVCSTVHAVATRSRPESGGSSGFSQRAPNNQPSEMEAIPF